MSQYAIKITGAPRYDGEYDGGRTVAEAERHARSMIRELPRDARMRIVSFDFSDRRYPDGRVVTHSTYSFRTGSWE